MVLLQYSVIISYDKVRIRRFQKTVANYIIICFFYHNNDEFGKIKMCKKLDELSKLRIEDLYDLYEDEFTHPPIDIHKLLELLGVEYCALDFSTFNGDINGVVLPNQAASVMGAVAAHSEKKHGIDSVEISVNINDSYHRQRFTLAHELAHCMLHADILRNGRIELRSSLTSEEPHEKEANILAGEILIPEKILKLEPILFLPLLAEKFDVSENVMEARLKYLKMGYYKI